MITSDPIDNGITDANGINTDTIETASAFTSEGSFIVDC